MYDGGTTDHGVIARRVMRATGSTTLATVMRAFWDEESGEREEEQPGGAPYPSLVLAALDFDASPILLLSDLADHTKNLRIDPRVGLLFDGTARHAERLMGPRLSIIGRAQPSESESDRARFLAQHPAAALYAAFSDFSLWRVIVERGHLVAGFGRIHWIAATNLLLPPEAVAGVSGCASDIIAHMNNDHYEAVNLYATALLGQADAPWRMVGIDPEGADLKAETTRETLTARLSFSRMVTDASSARTELAELVKKARAATPRL